MFILGKLKQGCLFKTLYFQSVIEAMLLTALGVIVSFFFLAAFRIFNN